MTLRNFFTGRAIGFLLVIYVAVLIQVMIFKDVPDITIGGIILNFGGTNAGHAANLVPFATILPYLLGDKGLIIGGLNIIGNIILLLPLGFFVPLVWRNIAWKKALALAVATGLAIEGMQVLLRVGIFDIDDVILNALGVMIGYWASIILAEWVRSKKYKNIIITGAIAVAAVALGVAAVYRDLQHPPAGVDGGEGEALPGGDLCGGTGGTGQIVSKGDDTVTIKRNDSKEQVVGFTDETAIRTSDGPASQADLKIGDRVTLVGGPNSDGSFSADDILVCAASGAGE